MVNDTGTEVKHLVPGVMRCAKCAFRLVRTNLHVGSGSFSSGDSKTEPCPNGCGPLWPETWELRAREAEKQLESLLTTEAGKRPPASHIHCGNCAAEKCDGVAVAAQPPRDPSPEWLLLARAEGRAEFLAILLNESPEGFGETDEYIGSHAIADTGDYGSHWNEANLRELFQVDELTYSYLDNLASTYWSQQAEIESLTERLARNPIASESAAQPIPNPELFYLQVHGSYSGDSLIWWREGKHGYTCDIKQAHAFTREEAYAQHRCRPEDRPWRKDYVDAHLQHHVSNERAKWKDAQ